jgi:hypothetical protein
MRDRAFIFFPTFNLDRKFSKEINHFGFRSLQPPERQIHTQPRPGGTVKLR